MVSFNSFNRLEDDIVEMKEKEVKKKEPKDWKEVSVFVFEKTQKYDKEYDSTLTDVHIIMNGSNGLVIVGNVSPLLLLTFYSW